MLLQLALARHVEDDVLLLVLQPLRLPKEEGSGTGSRSDALYVQRTPEVLLKERHGGLVDFAVAASFHPVA